ncbi:MAG: class I SAM-dependent RNA methyltransferase [Dermatophilaceae bacterium]|nr:class I SAM-dependent RNA methyltransferase [Dermatophilaceae bacterium]
MVGTQFEAKVGKVAHGGHCVARHDGRVVFVRHALPGETVRVAITEGRTGDRFLLGDAVEVLAPSPHRVQPACPFAGPGRCGGCDWQHSDLTYQRELKSAVVAEQFQRLAGLEVDVQVEALPGDTRGVRWRTRTEFAIDSSGAAGLHRNHSHEIIPLTDCLISTQRVIETGVLGRQWPMASSVDVVDASGEALAVAVRLPSRGSTVPHITERVETDDWSAEFRLSARGFWQVHPRAAATFVAHVRRELAAQPGERALDLYAGVGLFALALADAVGPTGAVLAIESDARAIADAKSNLQLRPEIELRLGKVDRALKPLVRQGIRADLVVLDPPRTGAGKSVIKDVAALGPRLIAYLACDPAALARDVAYARSAGYGIRSLRAFDAFPMTHHVECIAILEPLE